MRPTLRRVAREGGRGRKWLRHDEAEAETKDLKQNKVVVSDNTHREAHATKRASPSANAST